MHKGLLDLLKSFSKIDSLSEEGLDKLHSQVINDKERFSSVPEALIFFNTLKELHDTPNSIQTNQDRGNPAIHRQHQR